MSGSGCTSPDEATPPATPSVLAEQRIPLSIGVYYPPEFLSDTHQESCFIYGPPGPKFIPHIFSTGIQSVTTFSRVFDTYFLRVRRFEKPPSSTQPASEVDAVLIPEHRVAQGESRRLAFDIEYDRSRSPWEVYHTSTIGYRFKLLDPSGVLIADWLVEGRAKKKRDGPLKNSCAVLGYQREAYALALEDAGRDFMQGFGQEPDIVFWLNSRGDQVSQRHALPLR
jgi:hypothetical protein